VGVISVATPLFGLEMILIITQTIIEVNQTQGSNPSKSADSQTNNLLDFISIKLLFKIYKIKLLLMLLQLNSLQKKQKQQKRIKKNQQPKHRMKIDDEEDLAFSKN
jgi:hypothetical protein